MTDILPPNRQQLEEFISNHETIRRFEILFRKVGEDLPDLISGEVNSASVESQLAEAKQNLNVMIAALEAKINALVAQYPDATQNLSIMIAALEAKINTLGSQLPRLEELKINPPPIGEYLASLYDVYFTSLAGNDLIVYDSTNNRWVNTADPIVDTISINDNAIFSGTSGEGNRVDITTPTFPWQDMLGPITIRGVAATDPRYTTYRGNLRQYQFKVGDFVEVSFHVLHDYVPSTDMYLHTHWSHNSAAVTSGSITWSFEIWYAKSHDQAPFPASKTITVTQNGSTTQYQHMIAEVAFTNDGGDATHYDRADIEIDGLIIVLVSLSANTLNAATDPFLHMCDIHYQTTSIGSKNKAPNFYVT
jgi:hypothetical protein